MPREKHPDKDLDPVLARADEQGWRIERGKRYFKMYCSCAEKHLKTVHLSPSDPNYRRNLIGQLVRATCWEE